MLSKMLRGSVNNTTNPAVPTDVNFNQVSLLLHGDGTNGAQNNTFLDSSTNNFTVTRNGNTTQGTNTPFSQADGYWSNYNPTASYLTVATNAAFTYGLSDFTMECWVYLTTTGAIQYVIDQRNSGTANAVIPAIYVSAANVLTYFVSNAAQITGTTALTVGTWYHVAVSRSTLSTKMFLNGVQEGSTYVDANNYAASRVVIGSNAATAGNYLVGYVSNVRLVNGTGVYTTTFTPATTPLTAITNTSLLTCQSNNFKDNSSNNFALTATGTPSVQPFSPFAPTSAYSTSVNGGSMYFDGTGDYLSVADNANLRFGTSAFTIQSWVYRNAAGTAHSIVSKGGASTGFTFGITSTNVLRFTDTTTNIDTTTTIPANAWTHVAAVRTNTSSSGFQLYINGVSSATSTVATNFNQTSTLYVGADRSATTVMNGYIADLRYVNGTAETITVPTAPLTAITNTQLLLSGTNAGIFDNAIKNNLETVGNAQVSTSVKKYGTGSIYIPAGAGLANYVTTPNSPQFNLDTGDFTIEFWYNAGTNVVSTGVLAKGWGVTGVLGPFLFYHSGTALQFFSSTGNSSWDIASAATIISSVSTGTWYHVAVARQGSSIRTFANGTLVTTVTSSATLASNTYPVTMNYHVSSAQGTTYIDDLRITKGVARYTANFTPPTAAFPNS